MLHYNIPPGTYRCTWQLVPRKLHSVHWAAVFLLRLNYLSHCLSGSLFFFPSHLLSSPFYSLPPSRNSDPGSHSRLLSPPAHYGSCLAFLSREDFSSSLVDSRRIVLTHARRSQRLIIFFLFFAFCKKKSKKKTKSRHGGIRTHGPPLVAFEVYH